MTTISNQIIDNDESYTISQGPNIRVATSTNNVGGTRYHMTWITDSDTQSRYKIMYAYSDDNASWTTATVKDPLYYSGTIPVPEIFVSSANVVIACVLDKLNNDDGNNDVSHAILFRKYSNYGANAHDEIIQTFSKMEQSTTSNTGVVQTTTYSRIKFTMDNTYTYIFAYGHLMEQNISNGSVTTKADGGMFKVHRFLISNNNISPPNTLVDWSDTNLTFINNVTKFDSNVNSLVADGNKLYFVCSVLGSNNGNIRLAYGTYDDTEVIIKNRIMINNYIHPRTTQNRYDKVQLALSSSKLYLVGTTMENNDGSNNQKGIIYKEQATSSLDSETSQPTLYYGQINTIGETFIKLGTDGTNEIAHIGYKVNDSLYYIRSDNLDTSNDNRVTIATSLNSSYGSADMDVNGQSVFFIHNGSYKLFLSYSTNYGVSFNPSDNLDSNLANSNTKRSFSNNLALYNANNNTNIFIGYSQSPSPYSALTEIYDNRLRTYTSTVTLDNTAPTISSVEVNNANTQVVVTFSENVYNSNSGSGALEASDFALSITGGTATGISATPTGISNTSSDPSTESNKWTLTFTTTGTANGSEVLKVVPATATSIYDAAGNAASNTQNNSNNKDNLTEKVAPSVQTALSINNSNTEVSIKFSEPVFKSDGSTALDISASGFTVNITGGVATLSSTSLAISNNQTFTFTPTLSGTPNGSEVLGLTGTVYDAAGNSLTLSGQNVNLIEKIAPTIQTALSINNANTEASITFSEPVFQVDKSTPLTITQLVPDVVGNGLTLSNTSLNITNNKTFTYTFSINGTPDGSNSFKFKIAGIVTDAAGNSLAVDESVTLNDKLAPTISLSLGWGSILNAHEDDTSKLVTVNTNGVENEQTITVTLNNKNYTETTNLGTGQVSYSIAIPAADLQNLTDGNTYSVTASVSDAAGNNATASTSFIVDKLGPVLSSVSIGSNSNGFAITDTEVTLTFTSNESLNAPPTVVFLSGGDAITDAVQINITGNTYTAKYTVHADDTDGDVTYTISNIVDIFSQQGSDVTSGSGSVTVNRTITTTVVGDTIEFANISDDDLTDSAVVGDTTIDKLNYTKNKIRSIVENTDSSLQAVLPAGIILPGISENTTKEISLFNASTKNTFSYQEIVNKDIYIVTEVGDIVTILEYTITHNVNDTFNIVNNNITTTYNRGDTIEGTNFDILLGSIYLKQNNNNNNNNNNLIICFPVDTPITTDQGIVNIQNLEKDSYTINGNKVLGVVSYKPKLPIDMVLFKQHALGYNMPNKDTLMTRNHQVYYNNIPREAIAYTTNAFKLNKTTLKGLPNNPKPQLTRYNKEVFNVILEDGHKMKVNNMLVETLHPSNELYKQKMLK